MTDSRNILIAAVVVLVFAVVFAATTWTSWQRPPTSNEEALDRQRAVVSVLAQDFGIFGMMRWGGSSPAEIEDMQSRIAAAREWARTVSDSRTRNEFIFYVDLYQRESERSMARHPQIEAIVKTLPRRPSP